MSDTCDLVIASVGAGLIVAAAQGTIGGVVFWLSAIGAAVFWGVIMESARFCRSWGQPLVRVPAAVGLLLSGKIGRGVIMLLVGTLAIAWPTTCSGRRRCSAAERQ